MEVEEEGVYQAPPYSPTILVHASYLVQMYHSALLHNPVTAIQPYSHTYQSNCLGQSEAAYGNYRGRGERRKVSYTHGHFTNNPYQNH